MRVRGGGCAASKPGNQAESFTQDLDGPPRLDFPAEALIAAEPTCDAIGGGADEADATKAALLVAASAVRNTTPLELFDNLDLNGWNHYNGKVFEGALTHDEELGDSAAALVDARFLIALAKAKNGRLRRRQDLPPEAFLDLNTIKKLGMSGGIALRIIAVSHPWQQPDNPDPKGINLRLLARVLEVLIKKWGRTYAVFLDFMSLHQKDSDGAERPPHHAALFERALLNMMDWYSHPKVFTLKLTALPEGYPNDGFFFPEGIVPNTASYFGRGWCFCESTVSNISKSPELVFDLGKFSGKSTDYNEVFKECAAHRPPPLMPKSFRVALDEKAFTSKKADIETVSNLYQQTFGKQMALAKHLFYSHLQWTDAEMIDLCEVLASGSAAQVVYLKLDHNSFGDTGYSALADVISKGSMPELRTVMLDTAAHPKLKEACLAGGIIIELAR